MMASLKRRVLLALPVLLLAGAVSMQGNLAYGVNVDDCKSIGIDSCKDIDMLDALCDKLFSGFKTCEEVCKSISTGEQFGKCVVCCNDVRGQLDLPY